jgi:hypothetical protein
LIRACGTYYFETNSSQEHEQQNTKTKNKEQSTRTRQAEAYRTFWRVEMSNNEMTYREFGSTGEKVSAIGVGGWHLGLKHVDERLAIKIVRSSIDRGINFMDNSWDYNDGASEIRMGKALASGYRDKVFLMTKLDCRSRK